MRTIVTILLAATSLLLMVDSQAKSLSWASLDVQARLENDGRLHVVEQHTILFDGDWNGGERRFRVESNQQLQLIALRSINMQTHAVTPLKPGNLSNIGEYKLFDGNVLRWRDRLPRDPPFSHATRITEIEYRLSGVVLKEKGGYRLNHDFAFADRPGEIAYFSARLELDSAWGAVSGDALHMERYSLPAGQGAVMNLKLSYKGDRPPVAIAAAHTEQTRNLSALWLTTSPDPWRHLLWWVVILLVVVRCMFWWRHDAACGKFAALENSIDAAWVKENLLQYSPEFVGAAWELQTSSNEVAAVLARMTLEKKLKSRIIASGKYFWRREVLELTLCCELGSLPGYERKLIDALFVNGGTVTDTDQVRRFYRKSGFDPTRFLRPVLQQRINGLTSSNAPSRSMKNATTAILLIGAVLAAGTGLFSIDFDASTVVIVAISFAGILFIAAIAARGYRNSVESLLLASLVPLGAVAVLLLCLRSALFGEFAVAPILLIVAIVLAALGASNSIFNRMEYSASLNALRMRKSFAAARRYFKHELGTSAPRIDDAWYPYLLAFGLGAHSDRWFKVYGATSSTHSSSVWSASAASTTGTPNMHTWTGGGGAFGGGGASGGWATAATGIATSIPAPSSGNSGGSSGGSSSGGGGGGGW